ncbi:fatty acid amide hydrolase 1-like isoform X1 [Daphnia pulicaria]|uniref:fatty acid amide hydrolase 1-like isoform X1 n=2 Tax=Daphnia pulicaria TaxID=35523 RepID=UPI001EEC2303|nr:fatty acid amide hydrolase 1-like isoform X1 [Daphnia pulicaria]
MLLVDNVLSRVFYGVRFVICKNPLIQIMGSLFPYSSIYMLKVSAGICVFYITVKALGNRRQKRLVKKTVSQKLKEVSRNKGRLEQNLTSVNQTNSCVELEISVLLQKLQDGHLSCVEVLRAYQAKALEITTEFNCITEFILEADEWAKKLDADAALGGKKGPLHGLPFSVKDNVGIIGYDSTIGISKFINQPSTEDAAIVIALKMLGAIPFCKTNIPQTNMSFGCSNPIWGFTMNPWDKERTPGGSTGGEACLIAAGGSPIGIGSDIGGSVRLPAAFCGIYSIKPTTSRISMKGFKKVAVANVGVASVPGIMARDSQTVVTVTKLLLNDNHLQIHGDPDLLPIPWNEKMFSEKRNLRIGYYEDDGFFPTTPGIRRAIQIAKAKLEASGHELVPFLPPRVEYVLNSFISILTADQSRYLLEALSNDDIDPVLKPTLFALSIPTFVKRLVVSLFSAKLMPVYLGLGGNRIRETHQLWSEITKKNLYKEEFLSHWREQKLDLCIGPCFACPAPRSVDVSKLSPALSYTSLYNFLDFPVGILPIDKENVEDQAKLEVEYKYVDAVCYLVKATTKGATGMPLAIQMIGLPYQEEMVLRGMEVLDAAMRQ